MGLTIDRYEVQRLLGQGAMGKVYLATDPRSGRDVALKTLTTNTDDPKLRDSFRQEARAIAALRHPNIVDLHDFSGPDAADLFLVMEYLPGKSLHAFLDENGPVSEAIALCIAHEIALALEHAHAHKLVHRDLKPSNISLHEGRVVLMDFGIAKAIAEGGAQKADGIGTPGFMAPEQFARATIDGRTDIFALGACLYFLVRGRSPFEPTPGVTVAELTIKGRYDDPRIKLPTLSDGFCQILETCLQPNAEHRFSNATALKQAIIAALRGHGVDEVRGELTNYIADPKGYAKKQTARALALLLRDLRLAVFQHDEGYMQGVVARLKLLGAAPKEIEQVPGVFWKKDPPNLKPSTPIRRLVFAGIGLALGLLTGALIGAALWQSEAWPKGLAALVRGLAAALR